ncbi:MAG TPA: hypothetical protein VKB57_13620 [Acidimicrobiales bacterium]|nr:hypothetical protein [Acidimicrobiales bacterium]
MSGASSSCHPARLRRFGETVDALCDGLARRAGLLDDALAAYRARCEVDYRVPTVDTGTMVRALASELRDTGRWTAAVGDAFAQSALVNEYMAPGTTGTDLEAILTVRDGQLVGYMTAWDDPYRGVAEGAAAQLAAILDVHYDQDEPPAWLAHLSHGGSAADGLSALLKKAAPLMANLPSSVTVRVSLEADEVAVLADGGVATRVTRADVAARILLPRAEPERLVTASRWISRAGVVATGAAAAAEQWFKDDGRAVPERAVRAAGRGGGVAVGAWGGAELGGAAGGLCGPGAVVCSPVLAVAGGIAGAAVGDKAMDRVLAGGGPKPAARDLGELRADIAAADGTAAPALEARADGVASDLARKATAGRPIVASRVESLVPDHDALERVIEAKDWSAARSPKSPAAVLTSSPPPDPWGGDWPWL